MPDQTLAPSKLTRDDGATIAYHHTPGKSPGGDVFNWVQVRHDGR